MTLTSNYWSCVKAVYNTLFLNNSPKTSLNKIHIRSCYEYYFILGSSNKSTVITLTERAILYCQNVLQYVLLYINTQWLMLFKK